ncbi:MAG: response regulator transcription factor [Bacteroidota bacterium]|nr:response regulator transcription factor [Bacteroidota bacterium]
MIRIFSIEDHPIIITGIRNLFRPSRDEIEVTGSANSVDEAIEKADITSFDIFMVDLWIPNSNPLHNVKRLRENFPGKPIVIFTSEDSSMWQRKMFEAGVMAYMLKNADKNEIKNTLEKVSAGRTVFSGFIDPVNGARFRTNLSEPQYILTNNQKELVTMLAQGLNQQQIADKKGVSVSTIEKTLYHVRIRCNARNNAELVRILVERNEV